MKIDSLLRMNSWISSVSLHNSIICNLGNYTWIRNSYCHWSDWSNKCWELYSYTSCNLWPLVSENIINPCLSIYSWSDMNFQTWHYVSFFLVNVDYDISFYHFSKNQNFKQQRAFFLRFQIDFIFSIDVVPILGRRAFRFREPISPLVASTVIVNKLNLII